MSEVRRITPEEALRLCEEEGHLYLDVRTEAEFAAGHPRGAHNVPYLFASAGGAVPNPRFLEEVLALYPIDRPIVVGCKSGGRSLAAASRMIAAGYARIVELRAGYDGARGPFGQLVEEGWLAKGLPSESVTPGGSYAELRSKL